MKIEEGSPFARRIAAFLRKDFRPRYGDREAVTDSNAIWEKVSALRSELWLDSGDAEAVSDIWTREFSALTTNNTLLNREIQKGTYDGFVQEAAALLAEGPDLDERERMLELAFMLNARHGLSLVERFDAYVSVEEHTDLAHDMAGALAYARRFHAVCPERFIVKMPFTPAGLLATRQAGADGIAVNLTLGFSARQNYVAAAIARPSFVNVFLGRLNSFVADNGLGDGAYVGEKATLASQAAVRELRSEKNLRTRQIAASLRDGGQVRDLAGVDVLTMPPKVARGFLELGLRAEDVEDRTPEVYEPGINQAAREIGVSSLWNLDDPLRQCVAALQEEDLDAFSPSALQAFLSGHGFEDLLPDWTDEQVALSRGEGKIPQIVNWSERLAERRIGVDSLMTLAGLNSFTADQAEMDDRVESLLTPAGGARPQANAA